MSLATLARISAQPRQDQHSESEDLAFPLSTPPDPGLQPLAPLNAPTAALPGHVTRSLVSGTSALSIGTMIERGCGFCANILAARFAGSSVFGAYSFAISAANQISTYAAGGIGATAARFSGKYPRGTAGYGSLARALALVSLLSAVLAVSALWFGAAPLARLLHKPEFTRLLRWASLSAAGILLLECARGFFVGQRRLTAIVLLSLIVGTGMITLLPAAAHRHSPVSMIALQGAITVSAVAICLLLSGPLSLRTPPGPTRLPLWPILREVWGFGLVQLLGLVGANLAGWWLTFLVARGDNTMVQMGFFGIASQMRNIVGIAPSLLTEGSYAVMADPGGEQTRTPHRVMALCSFASLAVALLLASFGILVVPWAIVLIYGPAYAPAGIAVAVGLATAVVHMGNAPAAARLTIISIRASGVINTLWAVFVAAAATLLLVHGHAAAWQALSIYFAAHILSSILVLSTLRYRDHVPPGMTELFAFATLSSMALVGLALLRAWQPAQTGAVTALMGLIVAGVAAVLLLFGRRYGWLPPREALSALANRVAIWVPGRNRGSRHV